MTGVRSTAFFINESISALKGHEWFLIHIYYVWRHKNTRVSQVLFQLGFYTKLDAQCWLIL